jgi:hypothetical protein
MALLHGDLWRAIGNLLCEGKTIVLVAFPSLLCLIDGEFRFILSFYLNSCGLCWRHSIEYRMWPYESKPPSTGQRKDRNEANTIVYPSQQKGAYCPSLIIISCNNAMCLKNGEPRYEVAVNLVHRTIGVSSTFNPLITVSCSQFIRCRHEFTQAHRGSPGGRSRAEISARHGAADRHIGSWSRSSVPGLEIEVMIQEARRRGAGAKSTKGRQRSFWRANGQDLPSEARRRKAARVMKKEGPGLLQQMGMICWNPIGRDDQDAPHA